MTLALKMKTSSQVQHSHTYKKAVLAYENTEKGNTVIHPSHSFMNCLFNLTSEGQINGYRIDSSSPTVCKATGTHCKRKRDKELLYIKAELGNRMQ